MTSEQIANLPPTYRSLGDKEDLSNAVVDRVVKKETAFNSAKFMPSGRHYFYFVKGGRYFCLSERYPVKRFKKTNLYMNEIYLPARTWHISDFNIGEVLGVRKAQKFDISKSVFRTFKLENDELIKKMFDLDFKYCKVRKMFKNNVAECDSIEAVLWKHFIKIKNVFLTAIINSEYPVVSWNDFTIFCNKCKIPDKVCNLSTIDRIYIATNVN